MALTGVVSGSGGMLISGGGDVMLTGANDYTGVTTISGGRLLLAGNVTADGTAGPLGKSTSAIRLVTANDGPTEPSASGRYGSQNSSILNNTTGAITVDRNIDVSGQDDLLAGSGPIIGSASGTSTTAATTFNGNISVAGNTELTISSAATTTLNGVISGSGFLRTANGGTIVLSNANTYSGGTEFQFVANASGTARNTIRLGNDAALGTGTLWITNNARKPIFIADGGARTIANNVGGQGGIDFLGTNPITMSGTIDLWKGTAISGSDSFVVATTGAATVTFSGSLIRGALLKGVNGATDTGVGTLVLSGNNSQMDGSVQLGQVTTAAVPFSSGVTQVTNSTSLGSGGMINNNTSIVTKSTLEFNAIGPNIATNDFISLNGTGSASLGAIHNKVGDNSTTGNVSLVRFAGTSPAIEAANVSSILVEPGTSFKIGTNSGNFAAYGSLNDVSGLGVGSVNSQDPASWTPATRGAGTAVFNKEGGGTLTVNRISNLKVSTEATAPSSGFRHQFIDRVAFDTLNVNAGTVVISAGRNTSTGHIVQDTAPPTTVAGLSAGPFLVTPSQNKTTFVKNLNIAGGATPTATLDLSDNDMIVDYTGVAGPTYNLIKSQIKSAYSGATWTGTGVTSAAARATAGSPHVTGLGYAEATSILSIPPGGATYSGVDGVDSTSVVVRYTWAGDANLDGSVDTVDFTILASNFSSGVGDWNQGDFNYDGFVDTSDLGFIAQNFPQGPITAPSLAASAPGGALGALVPEPASLTLVGLAAAGLLARRRRN